jgi:hypothetical protein
MAHKREPRQDSSQQQQGEKSKHGQFGGQRQQQQQGPARQPAPGGGEPEVQENLPDRERTSDRGTRTPPAVDVERE